jgi:hypothetical protein
MNNAMRRTCDDKHLRCRSTDRTSERVEFSRGDVPAPDRPRYDHEHRDGNRALSPDTGAHSDQSSSQKGIFKRSVEIMVLPLVELDFTRAESHSDSTPTPWRPPRTIFTIDLAMLSEHLGHGQQGATLNVLTDHHVDYRWFSKSIALAEFAWV